MNHAQALRKQGLCVFLYAVLSFETGKRAGRPKQAGKSEEYPIFLPDKRGRKNGAAREYIARAYRQDRRILLPNQKNTRKNG